MLRKNVPERSGWKQGDGKVRVIGITGGIGAGKTAVLSYIRENYNCRILLADEVGHLVKEPGQPGYEGLVALLGKEILLADGMIDKAEMADRIFKDAGLLKQVNEILHPAVERYINAEIEKEKESNRFDFFFVEAALLLDSGLKEKMEEIWYIYAEEQIRRERLKASRNYTDEKISEILLTQRTEDEFRTASNVIINNNEDFEDTKKQIEKKLGDYLWRS